VGSRGEVMEGKEDGRGGMEGKGGGQVSREGGGGVRAYL
jgi:hypothetical protein